jgi:hypothetical protein
MSHPFRLGPTTVLLTVLGLAAGAAKEPPHPSGQRSADLEVLILATASTRGEIEPCGCSKSQKGGMARRAAMIDSLREARVGRVIVVDAGDVSHPDTTRDERYNRYLFRSLGAMSYDVITLGELELYRGAAAVQSILDSTRVPVALANARFAQGSKPLGERFVLRKVGDLTVGVIGLLGQDFGDGRAMTRFRDAGFVVEDPFAAAAAIVPEVRRQADLVVVLSHLTAAASRDLARRVPDIDVLVIGHHLVASPPVQLGGASQPPGAELDRIAVADSLGPIMVTPGERGQHLAKTRVILGQASRRVLGFGGGVIGLTLADFPERSDLASSLRDLHEKVNSERKREQMIQELRASERRLVSGQDHFLGDLKCARCHFDIYQGWQGTGHARAWETLVDLDRDADPDCVGCHVTGLAQAGGYKGIGAVQDMRDVQCEACHGMGTLHDMSGMGDPEAGKATCVHCHTTENSPEFDFPIYWGMIEH